MNIDINNIDPKLHEEDDRIEAYLKGQMSAEEEQKFFKELEDYPELKEKAISMARLVKGLKEVGAEQDRDIQSVMLASSELDVESVAKKAMKNNYSTISSEVAAFSASKAPKYEQELIAALRNSNQTINEIEELRILTHNELEKIGLIVRREFEEIGLLIQKEAEELRLIQAQTQRESADQPKLKKKTLPRTAKWLSIAASLICIVWLGFTYNSYRNTTALGNQYEEAFNSGMIVRGQETQTEAEKKLQGLFTNVKENEKIDDTIHELSLYWELSTMDTYNDYTEYSTEIGWNLAIAHLKNNDKKEAKAVLEKLISVSEAGSAVNAKAKELLKKL